MPEEQKNTPEMNKEEKDLANFESEMNNAKDSSSAEKVVKEKLEWGKAKLVAKNFDKVAEKVKDSEKLKSFVNKIDEKGCLNEMAWSLKSVKNAETVKFVVDKVTNSTDEKCVKEYAKNIDGGVINKIWSKSAKEFINKIEEIGSLNSMASCIYKLNDAEIINHTMAKVNKSDKNCVKDFSRNIDGKTLNKLEPNNAKWFIDKVEEAWSLKNIASKINTIKDKDVVNYTVNKVTEKWDEYCLKEFSKNLGTNALKSMKVDDINSFARKSLMKWGNECAKAMESNKALMSKIDKWTSSLIKEYANEADTALNSQLENI